jgi:hypothetical protein
MATTGRRRITLFDLLVLTAATAVGLSSLQLGWPRKPVGAWIFTWPVLRRSVSGYPSKTWLIPIAERVAPFLPCLAAWTAAFLVVRLLGCRPRWRRLVLQPGFVAGVAALAVLAIESLLLIGSAKLDGRFGWSSPAGVSQFVANGIILLAHHAGWAVAVSWFTLVLIGRWRPEPSWVDRCGRALGCVWVVIGPMASLLIDHTTWWGDFISP